MKNVFQRASMKVWNFFDWSGEMSGSQMMFAYTLFGVVVIGVWMAIILW